MLAAQNYQIYTPTSAVSAELYFSNWDDVSQAFAADCARMSTAALESIEGITRSQALPRGVSWLMVRAYYGGFFAAHAITRMRLGTSGHSA